MKKIDNATATVDNQFTGGNPVTATPATILDAEWLNVLQNEVVAVVEAGGATLDQTGVDRDQMLTAITALIAAAVPDGETVGSVTAMAMDPEPTGWLECDGSAISRTTYATLFAAIGTTFGAGDGATTFNIPDLRGEFIRGFDNGRGIDSGRNLGSSQDDEFRSHTHTVKNYGSTPFDAFGGDGASLNRGSKETEFSGGNETRPRNIAMMYCIKF